MQTSRLNYLIFYILEINVTMPGPTKFGEGQRRKAEQYFAILLDHTDTKNSEI